jgi:hypothetical protein
MKNIVLLTTIGAMVTFGAARLSAQSDTNTVDTNTVTTTTNVVQTINIALSGFEQAGGSNSSAVTPFHIGTKDVLRDLQAATGTTFSPRAKLTAVTPLGGGSTAFIVQDPSNTNSAQTDVTSLLSATTVGAAVEKAHANARGKITGTQYSIESFNYGATDTNGAASTAFTLTDVQGFTTTQLANGAFNAAVHGSGTRNGDPIVVKGNITGGPGKFQEVSQ